MVKRLAVLHLLLAAAYVSQSFETPSSEWNFQPLNCNANLASVPCESWFTIFSNASNHSSEIVIPCGKCINMDYTSSSSSSLQLHGGLDIQGKLVFADGYKLTLETPYVRVQGALHMSSTKIPNGQPDVRFVLTGTSEEVPKFLPADNNANVCGGLCGTAGKKPIVIAGGKLVIAALPPDFPTWVNLYNVIESSGTSVSALVLADSVQNKWGIGAEILITSHTLNYDDDQVRTITNIQTHTESGYVVVQLDSPIFRPTTITDSPDFAVEVALLARNIVFEGAKDDPNSRHGGHLMILSTSLIPQKLEGVELRNFGQQGNLGRYPIHFHLSFDNTGSVVSKNLIRDSNQRCVVIHGTHNVLVEGNVAYNTAGHCFITEDGIETGNVFRNNLGALTVRVETIISNNGNETDDKPSTFWMTNPRNTWDGNVAAGSQDSGFWLELRKEARGPLAYLYPDVTPRFETLALFQNNVAHSNADKGIRTYPSGYDPVEDAKFIGCRAYRNDGAGIFFHNSQNMTVVGGVFADNREQLDLDNAEYVTVRDASVIGISPSMKRLAQSQDLRHNSPCQSGKVAGIVLHTFTRNSAGNGAVLENVDFSGFVDTGCEKAIAIVFDDEVRRGTFDYFSVLSGVSIEDGAVPVDFCAAQANGITDIYLTDLGNDSQVIPTARNIGGMSTIISDQSIVSTFLPSGACTSVPEHCVAYCENTCLRTVTYKVDPTGSENYVLRVCSTTGNDKCIDVYPSYWYQVEDLATDTLLKNSRSDRPRFFAVHLPKGAYHAQFFDRTGNVVWPTYVEEQYEDALCSEAFEDGAVELIVPPPNVSECSSLIRNGNAESSPTNHTFWLHRTGGITLAPGEGVDGSNALSQLVSDEERSDAIVQYLDVRCFDLMRGRQYEVIAWVKLKLSAGESYFCDVGKNDCPEIGLYGFNPDGSSWKQKEVATVLATSDNQGEYQILHGFLDVTDIVASASRVMLYVQRNKEGAAMYVDNVSLNLVPSPDDPEEPGGSTGGPEGPHDPGEPRPSPGGSGGYDDSAFSSECVYNGDFDVGDSRSWVTRGLGYGHEVVSPGFFGGLDYALASFEGGMEQEIQVGCLRLNQQYIARAKFKIIDEKGDEFACEGSNPTDETQCPVMRLMLQVYGQDASRTVAYIEGDSTDEDWNSLFGGFEAEQAYADAETIILQFRNIPTGMTLIVDEVSIAEYGNSDSSSILSSGTTQSVNILLLGIVLFGGLLQILY